MTKFLVSTGVFVTMVITPTVLFIKVIIIVVCQTDTCSRFQGSISLRILTQKMNNSFALLCSLGILLVAVRGQGQGNQPQCFEWLSIFMFHLFFMKSKQ